MKKRGQSTIEIVVLLLVIGMAVFLMRNYINRAMQGKLKESADKIGTVWDYTQNGDSSYIFNVEYNVTSNVVETYTENGVHETNYEYFQQERNVVIDVGEANVERFSPDGY